MTRQIVSMAIVLVLGVCAATSAQQRRQPAREQSGTLAARGWIGGRLTSWTTGAPVRGAEVTAFLVRDPGGLMIPGGHQTTITDDEGRFEFQDVPLGAWRVTATRTGYVPWQLGQRRPFEVPPLLVLSARRDRVTADFAIPTAGAIEGRVYDEFGDPVTNVRVTVYRARMARGQRHLQPVGRADRTDDTGGFRVYGLPPGQYYVAASLRVAPADAPMDTTYAPTYFPGTGNLAEAQRIALEPGGEAIAEFPLLPVRRLRVTGSVFTSGGAPASAFLNLLSESSELGMPLGAGAATRSDGSFTLPDVSPGRYTLFASLRGNGPGESAEIPVIVVVDDVTGLTLVTSPPTLVRGTLAADAAATRPLPRGMGVLARSFRVGGPMAAGIVSGNTFEVSAPAGSFRLEVNGVPDEWGVKSIEIAGVDATDTPVDLRSQRSATARVVLTDRLTEIAGSIAPGGQHRILVFPSDPAKWSNPSRYIRVVQADAKGAFRITGLPPGTYRALAVDYLEEGEGEDPEFLAAISPHAAPVPLREGERLTITPPVVLR